MARESKQQLDLKKRMLEFSKSSYSKLERPSIQQCRGFPLKEKLTTAHAIDKQASSSYKFRALAIALLSVHAS